LTIILINIQTIYYTKNSSATKTTIQAQAATVSRLFFLYERIRATKNPITDALTSSEA
jgi:hypothetical protein